MKRRYQCFKDQEIHHDEFFLRTIQDEDIEDIRKWRNDQIDVLRQTSLITKEQQKKYFEENIWPEMEKPNPKNILFTIFNKKKRIGYGGLVHIAWEHRRAEVSFLINTYESQSKKKIEAYFSKYLKLIKSFAFDVLELRKLTTETFAERKKHIKIMEKNGFYLEGILKHHNIINGHYVDSLCHASFRKKNHRAKKILVSCSGNKIPLLRSISESLMQTDIAVKVFSSDSNPDCISKRIRDRFLTTPEIKNENTEELLKICKKNRIRLIIPTRDGELIFWASQKKNFESINTSIIISDLDAIKVSIDKLLFSEFGVKNNLPIIPAWEKPLGDGPFVVKERFGAGSRSIGINLSKGLALEHATGLNNPIYQPFIKGKEISVDAWIDKQHKVKGLVLRERNEIENGESVVTTTFRNEKLEKQCTEILELLPLHGPVVLQLIIDNKGDPHIIELNARFGGASTASIAAGLDIWYWTLLELDGQDLSNIPFLRSEKEVRQIRVKKDIIIYDPSI